MNRDHPYVLTSYGKKRADGKLFASLIQDVIGFLVTSKEPDYGISDECNALLAKVGGTQIDRLLTPTRNSPPSSLLSQVSSMWAAALSARTTKVNSTATSSLT
ncbi:MAG: hypothetical protein LBG27_00750 [Spirochaetaceae bacterium]|nr:hypothetical protein [Spirochaetaceae bacterium]